MSKNCLVIAGELSGQDHAMSFIPQMLDQEPELKLFGVGGNKLKELGVDLLYHLKDFSSMGVTEVLGKIPFYFKAMDHILSEVQQRNCKTAILIDFQGFNLKLAKRLNAQGVKVLYYVAPQAWAWKAYRAKLLEKYVHTLFTILPFEKKWFSDRGVSRVRSVMHPLAIEYKNRLTSLEQKKFSNFQQRPARILLLPGSRNSEVSLMLPVFIQACELMKEARPIEVGIVKTSNTKEEFFKESDSICDRVWDSNELFEAAQWADACMATSGTVTLAVALFGLPTVVGYRLNMINEMIFRSIITYDGPVCLANIVHEEYVFPEFLHYRADKYNMSRTLLSWLGSESKYDLLCSKLMETRHKLKGDDFDLGEYMLEVINES